MGYVPNDLCTFCEAGSETVHHLFLWKQLENFWFALSGQYEEFTLKDVFVGRQVGESYLSYLFVLAKLHIWNCRKCTVPPRGG